MREHETPVRDGRDAGEAPLLLLRGGEAQLREARDRPLADLPEPHGRAGGAVARERLEVGDVPVRDAHATEAATVPARTAHATAASARSQSYPFSSSSSARSLPPDLTIRPAASTCTTSGWMCVRIR